MRFFSIVFIIFTISMFCLGCTSENQENGSEQPQMALTVGTKAPDFSLADQNGEKHTLSEYLGKNVILYFYPKDDTPGCTKEACSFRDDLAVFKNLNTIILGVSVDDPESHKKFAEKYDLNFTLLADVDKKVSKLYNTINFMGLSKRHTYVIDKNGIIQQIYTKVDVNQHSQEIADFIQEKMM